MTRHVLTIDGVEVELDEESGACVEVGDDGPELIALIQADSECLANSNLSALGNDWETFLIVLELPLLKGNERYEHTEVEDPFDFVYLEICGESEPFERFTFYIHEDSISFEGSFLSYEGDAVDRSITVSFERFPLGENPWAR